MKVSHIGLFVIALATARCGSETKSKKEQANDFFSGQLQSPALVQCNQEKHFFNLAEGKCIADLSLASWACDRNGLVDRIKSEDSLSLTSQFNASSLKALDDRLKAGFEFHQCGESTSDSAIHVQLIKKSTDSSSASLQSGEIVFLKPLQKA